MIRLFVAFAVTIAVGLASRQYSVGWYFWDRIVGEILFAVAAYLVWAFILFRKSPWLIAGIAFGCCFAVELFKLTGIPAANQDVWFVRWFLGMTYATINIVYYFAGALLSAITDKAFAAPKGRP
jgi:hypothetical protein